MRSAFFLLCLFLASTAAAQGLRLSPSEHREAEALLESADLEGLRAWMLEVVGRPEAAPRLQAVLDRVDALLGQSYAYTRVYIDQRLRMADRFTDTLVGPLAVELYARFTEQARAGNDAEAIALFEAAQYVRVRHEGEVLDRLRAALDATEAAYARGDIAAADSALAGVRPYYSSPATQHREPINRLMFLDGRVGEVLGRAERQERFYGQSERVSRRVSLALGGSILQRAGTGALTLSVPDDTVVGPAIDLVGFGSSSTPVLSAEGHVYLTSFLSIGGGAWWNPSSYSNENETEAYFVDIPVTSQGAFGSVRSLLRTAVGMRPYVSAGVGVLHVQRESSEAAVLLETPDQETVLRPFTLPGEEETGLQVRTSMGFEYLGCGSCVLSTGIELAVVRNLIESDFAPDWEVALGIRLFASR